MPDQTIQAGSPYPTTIHDNGDGTYSPIVSVVAASTTASGIANPATGLTTSFFYK